MCSSVGTRFRLSWKRGGVEQHGEKERNVRERVVTREMTEVKVADNDVAPVRGLS